MTIRGLTLGLSIMAFLLLFSSSLLASEIALESSASQQQKAARSTVAVDVATENPAFLLDERFMAGDAKAPVVLVVYACGRSATCALLIPSLYSEVTTGRLLGKVRLYFRPYLLEKREEASVCGRALVAAADQGRFWPFLLKLYENQDNFKQCMLRKWADVEGMDGCAFDLAYTSTKTKEYLEASQQEARRNKVESSPGVFINRRKYVHELSAERLVDVLLEESEHTKP